MGESEAAIETLKRAGCLIDPERDPRLALCVQHNLVDNFSKMGRHTEVVDLLPGLRELAASHGGALDHLRLRWVEGRVAAGLGEHERARRLLGSVRQTFLEDGNPYEAALATLDLVISHLAEGDHDVSREAMAALLFFQEAARREAVTVELARQVAAAVRRGRDATGDMPG